MREVNNLKELEACREEGFDGAYIVDGSICKTYGEAAQALKEKHTILY